MSNTTHMNQPTPAPALFFLVWNPANDAAPRYRHGTLPDAVREAERLATLHPGQEFHVLRAVAVSTVPPPVVTSYVRGEEPKTYDDLAFP